VLDFFAGIAGESLAEIAAWFLRAVCTELLARRESDPRGKLAGRMVVEEPLVDHLRQVRRSRRILC